MPEKEKQSRDQMNMVYKTIIEKGLAKEDQIMFVTGRGGGLNASIKKSYEAAGENFKMYGPANLNQGGFCFGTVPHVSNMPFPSPRDNGN